MSSPSKDSTFHHDNISNSSNITISPNSKYDYFNLPTATASNSSYNNDDHNDNNNNDDHNNRNRNSKNDDNNNDNIIHDDKNVFEKLYLLDTESRKRQKHFKNLLKIQFVNNTDLNKINSSQSDNNINSNNSDSVINQSNSSRSVSVDRSLHNGSKHNNNNNNHNINNNNNRRRSRSPSSSNRMIHLQHKIIPSKLPSSSSSLQPRSLSSSSSFDGELLNQMHIQHNRNNLSNSNHSTSSNRSSSRGRKVFGNSEPFLARMKLKVKDPYNGRVPSFDETIIRLKNGLIRNKDNAHGK